jgi:hypothetical protein
VRYRVTWDPAAFRRLVQEWTNAGKPDAAIEAFDAIEEMLNEDPDLQGESRSHSRRILIVPPLGVIFRAKQESGEVLIIDAWLIRSRG